MQIKKICLLTLSLLLTILASSLCQANQWTSLKARGIYVDPSEAPRLWQNQAAVVKLCLEVIPSKEPIKPMEFLDALEECPPNTPTKEIINHFKAKQALSALGKSKETGNLPTPEELQAARYLLVLDSQSRIGEWLAPVLYLQQNGEGLNIQKPTLNEILAVQRLFALHNNKPSEGHVKAGTYLISLEQRDFGIDEVEATLYLQTNPTGQLDKIDPQPEWSKIKATAVLQKEDGLNEKEPAEFKINAMVKLQTIYRKPTKSQFDAALYLEQTLGRKELQKTEIRAIEHLLSLHNLHGQDFLAISQKDIEEDILSIVLLQDWIGQGNKPEYLPPLTLEQVKAVKKAEDPSARQAMAWAIQNGFGECPAGAIPAGLGCVMEINDKHHHFKLVTIAETTKPKNIFGRTRNDLEPLPEALEKARDCLDHVETVENNPYISFKVANENLVGLNRLIEGKLALNEWVVFSGLSPDKGHKGALIMENKANQL